MNLFSIFLFLFPIGFIWAECSGDCSLENQYNYKCEDRSEFCEEWGKWCENVFLHKCVRKACPKKCKVCHSSGEEPKPQPEPKPTTIIIASTITPTPNYTATTPNNTETSNYPIETTTECTNTTTDEYEEVTTATSSSSNSTSYILMTTVYEGLKIKNYKNKI